MQPEPIPRSAFWLGIAGVLPFLVLAGLFAAMREPPQIVLTAFTYYAATILAFLGGIRWGGAVNLVKQRGSQMVLSVVPQLWAVMALLIPTAEERVLTLLVGIVFAGMADAWWPGPAMPLWMRTLRLRLTAAVVVCFAMVGIGFVRHA